MGISIEQYASIVPVLEHNCIAMKNYLTCTKIDIPIATQCGWLSAHIIKLNTSSYICNNMSTDFCKRYMTVHKNISLTLRYVHC